MCACVSVSVFMCVCVHEYVSMNVNVLIGPGEDIKISGVLLYHVLPYSILFLSLTKSESKLAGN